MCFFTKHSPYTNCCRDVWVFDKSTGQLEARSTCFDCVHNEQAALSLGLNPNATLAACDAWENRCFVAEYDNHNNNVDEGDAEDDMTSCFIFYIESDVSSLALVLASLMI